MIYYIPHGGGPLPVLGESSHTNLVQYLKGALTEPESKQKPDAIVLISAHWEQTKFKVTAGQNPPLIYDYGGFPEESYSLEYPAPGSPELAAEICDFLTQANLPAAKGESRGFDHGMFIPLMIMHPQATIPVVQMSLLSGLDPKLHVDAGRAIAPLLKKNIAIIGSGMSFHNMQAFFQNTGSGDTANDSFQDWLIETVKDPALSEADREKRLADWESAPAARYAHPREEHLIPLMVCAGAAFEARLVNNARIAFDDTVLHKRVIAVEWYN